MSQITHTQQPSAPPIEPLLTTNEVAQIWHVSASTVLRAVKDGKLAALSTPGGHKRFRRADVENALGGASS